MQLTKQLKSLMKKKLLRISIIGKTNAGKSTFINNIIGEIISITNKKINTTEDLIVGILNSSNIQLVFYDTPGLNFSTQTILKNKLKNNFWKGLELSEVILYLIDIKKYNFNEIDKTLTKLKEINKKIIIVFNKNDLVNKKYILPKIKEINQRHLIDSFFSISAKKKHGLQNLKKYLLSISYYNKWIYLNNEITNKDDKFISNEGTRNSILSLIHKEIPYNIIITNKMFKYLKNGDLKIKQEIFINNPRYKMIILGKKGDKIKEIRTKTQKYLSNIFKTKVHLYISISLSNAK